MKNKKILITGGAGFIGTNLAKELLKNNEVIILDKEKSEIGKSIVTDVTKKDWFEQVRSVDYIFHLAAIVGVDYVSEHPEETEKNEIEGIKNIIDFAKKYCKEKLIYSSTSSVYESKEYPTSYNKAKAFSEEYLHKSGLRYSIIRYFNVYGKYQKEKMVVSRFINLALKNEPLVIFMDGNQTRDFTFVDDAVNATILIAESNKTNSQTIDIGAGNEIKIVDLANLILDLTKSKSQIVFGKPYINRENFEVVSRRCDPSKLKVLTGFECKTVLRDGLKNMIRGTV